MSLTRRSGVCSHVGPQSVLAISGLSYLTGSSNIRCTAWTRHSIHSDHSISASPAVSTPHTRRAIASNGKITKAPLAHLPFSSILRGYLVTALTSSPLLLSPALRLLSAIAYSSSPLLSPGKNPVVRWVLKKTVYKHFCAGENPTEVNQTVELLRKWGILGVLLGYAREVEMRGEGYGTKQPGIASEEDEREIREWSNGTLETVEMAPEGDFVCLKLTGSGSLALLHLANNLPPPPYLQASLLSICDLARSRNIRLCIDAEQDVVQRGIESWTMWLQRQYNRIPEPDLVSRSSESKVPRALIYGTMQAYLRSTPSTLVKNLEAAAKEGFVLGVKLVRGAYLGSDPRELLWSSKTETDAAYDSIAECLVRRRYGPLEALQGTLKDNAALATGSGDFPEVNLVLAGHNTLSVRKIMAIREQQIRNGERRIEMVYAQLLGMADHVSGELIQAASSSGSTDDEASTEKPRVCKYMVWGSVEDCTKYLVRRAEENRDAVQRTLEAKVELRRELWRRALGG